MLEESKGDKMRIETSREALWYEREGILVAARLTNTHKLLYNFQVNFKYFWAVLFSTIADIIYFNSIILLVYMLVYMWENTSVTLSIN